MPLSPVLPNDNDKIESLLKFINQASPSTEMVLAILDRVYRYLHDDPDVKLISVN